MNHLLIKFLVTIAFSQCASGASINPLIVGGKTAERGQFPYLVQVTYYTLHTCGGAILNENWILTTAKCVGEPDVDHYRVIANQYNIHQNEGSERSHNVSGIFLHPDFFPGFARDDIALVKLSTPLTIDALVQPIPLPPANHTPADGTNCTIPGWGPQTIDGRDEAILRFVEVPIINRTECDEKISRARPGQRVGIGQICAGDTGAGICIGDTGGPLVANDLPNGSPYLSGLAAWFVHCGEPETPEVYTDVGHYLPWIVETMENNLN